MLFTIAQPLALVTDNNYVLGAFVGLVTVNCIDSPKRYTRSNKTTTAEQYCLYQRLCSLKFTELYAYRTTFVAANSMDVADQFIWAQMTIGKTGYTGCTKLPIISADSDIRTPFTYTVAELGQTAKDANICVIKFPYGSFIDSSCEMISTKTDLIESYCNSMASLTQFTDSHPAKTVCTGMRIGEETHAVAPFEVEVLDADVCYRFQLCNVLSRDIPYIEDLIRGCISSYNNCLAGEENDKLEEIAFKYGKTAEGYCRAVYAQIHVFVVPIQSVSRFSFKLVSVLDNIL